MQVLLALVLSHQNPIDKVYAVCELRGKIQRLGVFSVTVDVSWLNVDGLL